MNGLLEGAVAGLVAAVGLVALAIVCIRTVVGRRRRRESRLRPQAESAIASFLTDSGPVPAAVERGERATLLEVALEMLADLLGGERARLAALLEELGYVQQAISALSTGRHGRSWRPARGSGVRRRAAELLAAVSPVVAVPALTVGLDDPDTNVRTTCARALAGLGGDDVTASVVAVAERDAIGAPGAAAEVVLALGRSRPQALAPLLGREAPPEAKAVAATVAGQLRLPEHAPLLRACLGERDELAAVAASGLGMIGDVDSVAALTDLAGDSRRAPSARAAATVALGSIGDSSALPMLDCLLHATDWSLRACAAAALSRLGNPGMAALRRAAISSRPDVAVQAEAALAQ